MSVIAYFPEKSLRVAGAPQRTLPLREGRCVEPTVACHVAGARRTIFAKGTTGVRSNAPRVVAVIHSKEERRPIIIVKKRSGIFGNRGGRRCASLRKAQVENDG